MLKKLLINVLSFFSYYKIASKSSLETEVKVGPKASVLLLGKPKLLLFKKRSSFYGKLVMAKDSKFLLGENSTIRYSSLIEVKESVLIGRNVIISNNVIITDNDSHPTDIAARNKMCQSDHEGDLWSWDHCKSKPIIIEDSVWIGRNATIMKGVIIGKGSVIASDTVVTKNVPEFSLAYGNPAKIKEGKFNEKS